MWVRKEYEDVSVAIRSPESKEISLLKEAILSALHPPSSVRLEPALNRLHRLVSYLFPPPRLRLLCPLCPNHCPHFVGSVAVRREESECQVMCAHRWRAVMLNWAQQLLVSLQMHLQPVKTMESQQNLYFKVEIVENSWWIQPLVLAVSTPLDSFNGPMLSCDPNTWTSPQIPNKSAQTRQSKPKTPHLLIPLVPMVPNPRPWFQFLMK